MPRATRNSGNSGNLKYFEMLPAFVENSKQCNRHRIIHLTPQKKQRFFKYPGSASLLEIWWLMSFDKACSRMKLLAGAPPIHQRHKCSVVDQLEDAHRLPRLPCIRSLVFKRAHDNVPNLYLSSTTIQKPAGTLSKP